MSISWNCPHCNHAATVGKEDRNEAKHAAPRETVMGPIVLKTYMTVCPNRLCREISIKAHLYKYDPQFIAGASIVGKPLQSWNLRPDSEAKALPQYIPEAIVNDYSEACRIKDLSPKASATLSRRCLQGMIRDFWKVQKKNLFQEIEAIKDKIDPETWEAIDGIRTVGNIGAHMEQDIDRIIDVDPEEAQLLITLIENLIEEWYIARWKRQENRKQIITLAKDKDAAKKPITT